MKLLEIRLHSPRLEKVCEHEGFVLPPCDMTLYVGELYILLVYLDMIISISSPRLPMEISKVGISCESI